MGVLAEVVSGAIQGTTHTGFALRDVWERRHARRREDNAVQRRVADMRAAGINPVLAAGQPAASMAPAATHQPDTGHAVLEALMMGEEMRRARAETDNMRATQDLIKANVDRVTAEAENVAERTKSERRMRLYEGLKLGMAGAQTGIDLAEEARAQMAFNTEMEKLRAEAQRTSSEAVSAGIQAEIDRRFGITDAWNRSLMIEIERQWKERGIMIDIQNAEVQLAIAEATKKMAELNAEYFGHAGIPPEMARHRDLAMYSLIADRVAEWYAEKYGRDKVYPPGPETATPGLEEGPLKERSASTGWFMRSGFRGGF